MSAIKANDRNNLQEIQALLLNDVPIYAVTSLLLALCMTIFAAYGVSVHLDLFAANAGLYVVAGVPMAIFDAVWLLFRNRPEEPIRFIVETYRRRACDPALLARVPLLGVAIAFMPFFSKIKSMIPLFNDFKWDATFIAFDRALFFGKDAWQVLHPVFGSPVVTAAAAGLYHAWMMLIYMGTLFFVFHPSATKVVRRYVLSFVLIWVLIGGVLATALASVGPCFVGPILGDDTFNAQMAYLRAANEQIPVLTLPVQDLLLQWYQEGSRGLGRGITAMPSMHVSMSFLFWLAIRKVSLFAGRGFFLFFNLIWLSSVHLGYHYFADGLVGVIATAIIWHGSETLLQGWDRLRYRGRTSETALA
ncbi:phosphatase PAP2 family protein [Novosphingobium sp. Gsoil 351]|uniref:phosphatase PAP2 family protein n=1 Tax=Novosphingobium sp. Gsoil 351 TaxID=2675225 RepID=UPI0012B441FC|nr:phosphatase PAP2 family protein [Novosphingobium sp. Gsoil 351]QGN55129.1 hypothetical protein GKE62_11785 [Novosphingobium sp. Gsoil 351]